jgi:glycerophosphoryl diester phosphodiesterase
MQQVKPPIKPEPHFHETEINKEQGNYVKYKSFAKEPRPRYLFSFTKGFLLGIITIALIQYLILPRIADTVAQACFKSALTGI